MFARATRGACYPGGGPRGHGCSSIGHQRGRRANSISGRSNDSRSERRLLVVCRLNVLGPPTLAYCLRGRRPCVFARPLSPSLSRASWGPRTPFAPLPRRHSANTSNYTPPPSITVRFPIDSPSKSSSLSLVSRDSFWPNNQFGRMTGRVLSPILSNMCIGRLENVRFFEYLNISRNAYQISQYLFKIGDSNYK